MRDICDRLSPTAGGGGRADGREPRSEGMQIPSFETTEGISGMIRND